MKKTCSNIVRTICLVIFTVFGFSVASAQDGKAADASPTPDTKQAQQRPELLRQLGLTQDQVVRIRRLNMARKPQMDAAQDRLKNATMSLDKAIYTDTLDEADVAAKIKEVQQAQAEVQRLRFMGEIAVRKILSPEQLVRFRELRERFAAERPRANQKRATDQPPGKGRPMNGNRQLVRPTVKTPLR